MKFPTLVTAVAFAAVSIGANAAEIAVTDFTAAQTIINMSGAGAPNAGPFVYQGLTFSESSTSGDAGWRNLTTFGYGFTDNAGTSNITINLGGVFSKVGLDLHIGPASYTASFYDITNNSLGSITRQLSNSADVGFAGWESTAGIAKIRIIETSSDIGQVGGFNNIRLEGAIAAVPEPETYAMLLAGLGLMGAIARRRKDKQA